MDDPSRHAPPDANDEPDSDPDLTAEDEHPVARRAVPAPDPTLELHPPMTEAELIDFAPTWCLFWGRYMRSGQLDTWLPYLRRSKHRFALMTSEDLFRAVDLAKIADVPNVRVVAPYSDAVDWLRWIKPFKGFLYIGSQPENFRTVNHLGKKVHIYIGHGESGKATSGYRTGSLYDAILVAHYEAVDRFPPVIRRWVKGGAMAIGTSLVEGIHRDPWPQPKPIKTMLYAPTWESRNERGDFTSLDVVAPILIAAMPALRERGISVILRPHPGTGIRLEQLRQTRDAVYAAGAESGITKEAAFDRADVLISDVSGVTAEFLFTEKPSILPLTAKFDAVAKDDAWLDHEYPWVYRWPLKAAADVDVQVAALLAQLDAIEAGDPLRDRRKKEAARMFRGHRSIEEAVQSFELALEIAAVSRWRRRAIPMRWPYEYRRWRMRRRRR
ncbi:MAG TPA: CDP-glycerol glycerophosphotransferase family protein [Candidatus Limnocylindrales bacterium]|jgi:hypothetical protein